MSDPKLKVIIEVDGKQYAAELDKAADKTEKFTEQTKKSAAELSHFAGYIKAAYGALVAYGALNVAKNIYDINAQFESLNASLVTVTGSSQAAEQAFNMIEQFATQTPYQLQEVVQAFVKLKALGLDASEDSLRSYGNTASAMGKSLNDMIEAVADASTGEFERLKEFGIKASVQGDKVTLRFKGIETTIDNSAEAITGYLRKIGDEDFAGGMIRQMDTLTGVMSNLEDAAAKAARTFGESSGFNSAIRSAARGVTDFLNALTGEASQRALDDFRTKIEPNVELLRSMGVYVENIDPTNIERINRILTAADLRGIDLEAQAPFSIMLEQVEAITGAYQSQAQELDRLNKEEKANVQAVTALEKSLAMKHSTIKKLIENYVALTEAQKKNAEGTSKKDLETLKTAIESAEEYGARMYELAREAYPEATKTAQEYGEQEASNARTYLNLVNNAQAYGETMAELYREIYPEATRSNEEYGQYLAELARKAYPEATESAEEYGERMAEMLKKGNDDFDKLLGAVRGWGDEFTDVMVEATMTGKASFSDMTDSIIKDLLRIQLQKNISDPLVKAGTSFLDDIFSGGAGATTTPTTTPTTTTGVIAHTGALIGSGEGGRRAVDSSLLAGATRYHTGGLIGNREVPVIAEIGEVMFTAGQAKALGAELNQPRLGNVRVIMENKGAPKEARQGNIEFDSEGMILHVLMEDERRNGPYTSRLDRRYQRQGVR